MSYSSTVPLDNYYVHLAIDYVFEDGTSGSYDHEDIDKITENAIEFIGCIKFGSSGDYVDSTYKIEVFTSEDDQVPLTGSNAITIRENKP